MSLPRPIITLLSDFGLADYYAAAMKAVLLRHGPNAVLVDVTHQIPPQDILHGSIVLERAIASFPAGTVHLAVVDPGVGSSRRIILARSNQQLIVCPDNGLITWTLRRFPQTTVSELIWRPPSASHTFHGRDIMAPIAGQLAAGAAPEQFAQPLITPVLLDIQLATGALGKIIHFDHFGNATTNIPSQLVPPDKSIRVNNYDLGPLRHSYADVPRSQPLAIIGSSDLLEIAVNSSSARDLLELKVGDVVTVE